MDIQRQGNCTKRSLGKMSIKQKKRGGRERWLPSRAAAGREPRRITVEGFSGEAKRREASAVRARSKISASAQIEAIQLNQVCSGSGCE